MKRKPAKWFPFVYWFCIIAIIVVGVLIAQTLEKVLP